MENIDVRYIIEAFGSRLERANKRLFILNLILIVSLILSNLCWTFYVHSFEQETSVIIEAEQEADSDGTNYIIGGDYGKTEGKGN